MFFFEIFLLMNIFLYFSFSLSCFSRFFYYKKVKSAFLPQKEIGLFNTKLVSLKLLESLNKKFLIYVIIFHFLHLLL